VKKMCTRNY